MLMRAEIPLEIPKDVKATSNWGSLFHGAVLELMPLGLSDQLHDQGVKPWSQFITRNVKGQDVWVLCAINDEMDEALTNRLLERLPMQWNLRQKGIQIGVGKSLSVERISYRDLSDKHFQTVEAPRKHLFRFATPTTFKTAGKHVIFPTTDLIMNSLMQRWDAFADGQIGRASCRERV